MRHVALALSLTIASIAAPAAVDAQAARSAAARDAPAPPVDAMLEQMPAHMSAVMVGDLTALTEAIDSSLDFGIDTSGLTRAALDHMARRSNWYEHGVRLADARRLVLAFHAPTEHAVLIMDAAAVARPEITVAGPARLGFDAALHRLDELYGVTTVEGPWQSPAQRFAMAEAWPDAAPYVEDAIAWAYLSEPEIVRDLDREFFHRLSGAGMTRGLVALAPDYSATVITDTTVERAEEFLGRIRATAAAADLGPIDALVSVWIDAAMSEVTVDAVGDDSVAVRLPAPECGGLTQQLAAVLAVGAGWVFAEQDGLGVSGDWAPEPSLRSETCELGSATPSLPWEALRLSPDATVPTIGFLGDSRFAAMVMSRTGLGWFPFLVDEAVAAEALTAMEERTGLGPVGVVTRLDAVPPSFALVGSEALAAERGLPTREVDGIGTVGGVVPPDALPSSAPSPAHWERARTAAGDPIFAAAANGAALDEMIAQTPGLVRGAFTNALSEADSVVFSHGADGRLRLQIVGIPSSLSDPVGEHVAALASDAADLMAARFPPTVAPFIERVADSVSVEPADDGVTVVLPANMTPLTALVVAAAGERVMRDFSQPTSMPMP